MCVHACYVLAPAVRLGVVLFVRAKASYFVAGARSIELDRSMHPRAEWNNSVTPMCMIDASLIPTAPYKPEPVTVRPYPPKWRRYDLPRRCGHASCAKCRRWTKCPSSHSTVRRLSEICQKLVRNLSEICQKATWPSEGDAHAADGTSDGGRRRTTAAAGRATPDASVRTTSDAGEEDTGGSEGSWEGKSGAGGREGVEDAGRATPTRQEDRRTSATQTRGSRARGGTCRD